TPGPRAVLEWSVRPCILHQIYYSIGISSTVNFNQQTKIYTYIRYSEHHISHIWQLMFRNTY
ncbi:unnamed protein product, partial [Staurois parvus]